MNGVRTAKSENRLKGKTKSKDANFTSRYTEAYLSMLLKDASVLLAGHYSYADYTLDLATLKRRVDREGLGFATKTLPTLGLGLIQLAANQEASFPQFKLNRSMKYPAFLGRLFHLALEESDTFIRQTAFDLLYSFTVAFKKLKGPYDKKVLFKQFKTFLDVDSELDNLDLFEESTFSILESARAIVFGIVRDFSLDQVTRILPRPGPGATNTPTEKTDRFRPSVLYKQIHNVLDYQEWWYPNPWDACCESRKYLALHAKSVDYPIARFKFVDKVVDKPRGICIEENEMQVMQQAFRCALSWLIQAALYPLIAFDDQSINAGLAFKSSFNGEHATLDMSEASDRVYRGVVSWMFQDNQELHDALMALSTRYVEAPKELQDDFPGLHKTQKYAPMGSALCFPVMSLVHYALCAAIVEHNAGVIAETRTKIKQIYVYGDDIICPVDCVQSIFDWLPVFGMKLNKTKSFYSGRFRESCGVHAYEGVDVTPVYVKYIPYHNTSDAKASVMQNERDLYKKGFEHTAELLRAEFRGQYGQVPLVPEGISLAGFSRHFDDEDLRRFKQNSSKKWSKRYQCYRYKVSRVKKQTVRKEIKSELGAYLRWLWVKAQNPGPVGQGFGPRGIGDSYGTLSFDRMAVLESALAPTRVNKLLDSAVEQSPIARPIKKREDVVHHKVVLRQSGGLQQQGAASFCCFC